MIILYQALPFPQACRRYVASSASWFAALAVCALLWIAASPSAMALERESLNGWRAESDGMRHFTELFCPGMLAGLSRLALLGSSPGQIGGCLYRDQSGADMLIRVHAPGMAQRRMDDFAQYFGASGFMVARPPQGPYQGLTFQTGVPPVMPERFESLWVFSTGALDYSVWMSYPGTVPAHDVAANLERIVASMIAPY